MHVYLDIEVKDDLGNIYEGEDNGGEGTEDGKYAIGVQNLEN